MLTKFGRTIRYLKPIQIYFQIVYRLSKSRALKYYDHLFDEKTVPDLLNFRPLPSQKNTAKEDQTFIYLNLSKNFEDKINWDFMEFGKLWNYNLQYADFINQDNLDETIRVNWLRMLYHCLYIGELNMEPYPVSLRCMNVIRFLSDHRGRLEQYRDLNRFVHAELTYLHSNYEYHLLGNHLLENAFAMLMGGHYFRNEAWKKKAQEILSEQLQEQITSDGAHFELSPMYHKIILFRVLEAIDFTPDAGLATFLKEISLSMLAWLKTISFKNGEVPHFNDSTDHITFTSNELLEFAGKLGIYSVAPIKLSSSNFRKFNGSDFETVIDVGGISPPYQPGHNHADHLSFVMHVHETPFIVDPGISTYNISARRQWERSSEAHNTVTFKNYNQSEVWGGFRVGKRATVQIQKEDHYGIIASVDYLTSGYKILHTRDFSFTETSIVIKDLINVEGVSLARYYLHPEVVISDIIDNIIIFKIGATISFSNIQRVRIEDYFFASGYNQLIKAKVIEVDFISNCQTSIVVS